MFRLAALLLLAASGLAACAPDGPSLRAAAEGPAALVALAVEAGPRADADSLAQPQATFQTDGAGAAWHDALAEPADGPAMGFHVGAERVLDAWQWWHDADSVAMGPGERVRGVARPDVAVRAYAPRDSASVLARLLALVRRAPAAQLTERVTLLDGRGTLLVEVVDSVGTVGFRPLAGDRGSADAYTVREADGVLAFARTDRLADSTAAVWTAVVANGGTVRSRAVGGAEGAWALGEIALPTPGRLAIAVGRTPEAAAAAAGRAVGGARALREARAARMVGLLESVPFETESEDANRAVRWAVLSLDALVRRDSARARVDVGLPGDAPASFMSTVETLPAFLATGQWATARGVLLALGDAQRFDRRLDVLGRAPDAFDAAGEPVFATADGTPLFLAAAGRYVRTTGERGIVSGGPNYWFKAVFGLRGVYEPDARNGAPTDSAGFFVTRARRPAWTTPPEPPPGAPVRIGAPAEAQGALWGALHTATDFAQVMGVGGRANTAWYADTARVLVREVERRFAAGGLLADRLAPGGRPAADVRPGGLLALARLRGALPDARRAELARPLAERLVLAHGVTSLADSDSLFHPTLRAPGLYDEAAARASGAIWTALAGPVVTLLAETGAPAPAAELWAAQARLVLETGTVGAIPELLDGHPRAAGGRPSSGGAAVSPWPLANLIASAFEGLVGAQTSHPDTLVLTPRLPEAWGTTSVRLRLGGGHVGLRLVPGADGALTARVEPAGDLAPGATLRLRAGGADVSLPLTVARGDTASAARPAFEVQMGAGLATVDGEAAEARPLAPTPAAWDGFALRAPEPRESYPVLAVVAERRAFGRAQVLRDNPSAAVVLTQPDPEGDDWGATSTFTYPVGWPPGVLDVTYLEVARDDSTTYVRAEFSALAPEGRTVVAVAFDTGDGGARTVGRGARYAFPDDAGVEAVVFVGDGLVVEDGRGRELGRLDGASAFDARTGAMRFALPHTVLPPPPRGTRVTLLVGALDPDDPPGLFRSVRRGEPSEAEGGGRVDLSSPTVYDVVVGTIR